MVVLTASPRVRHARKLVLELLASSVDLSTTPRVGGWMAEYGCAPERLAGATVAQPATVDNELFVRDLARCVLCYRCVAACGPDHQNSFAMAVAGRGFGARVSTERGVSLPYSACVFCGNCVAVCPTGALMVGTEYDARAAGRWDEARQTRTDTICPYCGVGCTLRLHVQDGAIVKVSSPLEHPVSHGNLCVKGRFGWRFVHSVAGG